MSSKSTTTVADIMRLPDAERLAIEAFMAKEERSLRWTCHQALLELGQRLLADQEELALK